MERHRCHRDVPDRPVWTINATNVETGKNWRFSKREMGDWQFGRRCDPPARIAEAAAASAAVPYVIGALKLQLPEGGWIAQTQRRGNPVRERGARHRPRYCGMAEPMKIWG